MGTTLHAGQVGDAGAFERSKLLARIRRGSALPSMYGRSVGRHHVNPFLIGDGAFRLEMYMMKGFPYLTPAVGTREWAFNKAMVTCRRHIENVFGRLIARWQILKAKRVQDLGFMNVVIGVCCALHNMCQRAG